MSFSTETKVIVRSTDCGPARRVQPHRFFTYFEQGRLNHLRDIGVLPKERQSGLRSRTFTIAETSGFFHAFGNYPGTLTVQAKTREVRNRSFILGYQVISDEDGQILVEGTSAQVWLDEEGRPASLSDNVRESLMNSWDGVVPETAIINNTASKALGFVATEIEIPIRYSDLDGDEIINNANYFVLFEHGRLNHLRQTGALPKEVTPREIALSAGILETTCRFRAPVRYPANLIVRTQTREVQGSVLTFDHEVRRLEAEHIVAEGSSCHAWFNEAGEPTDVPAGVITALLGPTQNDSRN